MILLSTVINPLSSHDLNLWLQVTLITIYSTRCFCCSKTHDNSIMNIFCYTDHAKTLTLF